MSDTRSWLGWVLCGWGMLACAALAGCGDNSSDSSGSDGGGDPPADADAPATWCAAYRVINCVCQQCHLDPPLNGAPLPLVSYADTQAEYVPGQAVYRFIQSDVTTGYMPFMGENAVLTPPVKALTAEQKDALLGWIEGGAEPTGGLDCPMTCDWTQGPPDGG